MTTLPRRMLLAGAVSMTALAAAALGPRPRKVAAAFRLESMVPAQFNGWRVDPVLTPVAPTPDVQAHLDALYEQLLARTYLHPTDGHVMLTIAYGGDQRDALRSHRQEVCYRAQGFTISGLTPVVAQVNGRSMPATRFVARMSGRIEAVTYWMTMGQRVIDGRAQRLMTQIVEGLVARAIPDGMVVRVSSIDQDTEQAYGRHLRFLDGLMSALTSADAQRLTGH